MTQYGFGLDFPPAVSAFDATYISNVSSSTYSAGTPEVGVYFTCPLSSRLMVTVHGGARDNTNDNRLFMSVQIFKTDANGEEIMAPSVPINGWGTPGTNAGMMYASRTFFVDGLTFTGGAGAALEGNLQFGQTYYARVMYSAEVTTSSSVDIANRGIIVEPVL